FPIPDSTGVKLKKSNNFNYTENAEWGSVLVGRKGFPEPDTQFWLNNVKDIGSRWHTRFKFQSDFLSSFTLTGTRGNKKECENGSRDDRYFLQNSTFTKLDYYDEIGVKLVKLMLPVSLVEV
ncbi:9561_t:CDS:2, partial [Cetraspora pellucida]